MRRLRGLPVVLAVLGALVVSWVAGESSEGAASRLFTVAFTLFVAWIVGLR